MKYKILYIIPCKQLDGYLKVIYHELFPDCPHSNTEYETAIEYATTMLSYYFGLSDSAPSKIPMTKSLLGIGVEINDTVESYMGRVWEDVKAIKIVTTSMSLYIYI